MKKELLVLQGLPASGKSTYALKLLAPDKGFKRVNKDLMREMLDGGTYSKQNEGVLNREYGKLIQNLLDTGYNVVVDDTNFNGYHLTRYREIADRTGAEFNVKTFETPLSVCIERDAARERTVGAEVIRKMYDKYNLEALGIKRHAISKQRAIICDIDGTIAEHGDRNVYDHARAGEDTVRGEVVNILISYLEANPETKVFFVTGRDEKFNDITGHWLIDKIPDLGVFDCTLAMRRPGDRRKSSTIKREIYKDEIEPKYNVVFVLEDRQQDVDMYREEGLLVLHVAKGDF